MGRLPLVKHVVTLDDIGGVGGDKYSLYAPDIYSDFNSETGVKKATADEDSSYKGKITSDDFKTGKVIRIKCRATRKNIAQQTLIKDFTVVVATGKLKSALAALEGKKIAIGALAGVAGLPGVVGSVASAASETWDIKTTRIPRRRRFS